MSKKILLTGLPHSGKSTVLNRLLKSFPHKQGLLTLEILEHGQRKGFEMVAAKGERALLATTDKETPYKVSRYFVNVQNIEKITSEIENFSADDLLYIDEIGQMELYSEKFKNLVDKYLYAENSFIGTISKVYTDDFIKKILSCPDIELIEITQENRGEVCLQLKEYFIPKS